MGCNPRGSTRPSYLLLGGKWSPRRDLNPRPAVYKTAALPLSYTGWNRHKPPLRAQQPDAACKGREPNRSNRLARESSVICPDLVKRQFQR